MPASPETELQREPLAYKRVMSQAGGASGRVVVDPEIDP